MKIFFIIAMCCVLMSCSSSSIHSDSSVEKERLARNLLLEMVACGQQHVAETDDGMSDAKTVALALALRCNREYVAAMEAWGASLGNDRQRQMFVNRSMASEKKAEYFLSTVMQYRQSPPVSKGNKS